MNWSTFRFAICQGGDGESDMTMDVQNMAMFVRDPGSVVTCILLPLDCSMHMHQQVSTSVLRSSSQVALLTPLFFAAIWLHPHSQSASFIRMVGHEPHRHFPARQIWL